jgi:hypothetical protein
MMEPLTINFIDGVEVLAGHITLNSGILTLKDACGDDKSSTDAISLDLEDVPEGTAVPVYYTLQQGCRFILIVLDAPTLERESNDVNV